MFATNNPPLTHGNFKLQYRLSDIFPLENSQIALVKITDEKRIFIGDQELLLSNCLLLVRYQVIMLRHNPSTYAGLTNNLIDDANNVLALLEPNQSVRALVYFFRAEIAIAQGDWKQAYACLQHAEQAIEYLAPDIVPTYDYYAKLAAYHSKHYRSVSEIKELIKKNAKTIPGFEYTENLQGLLAIANASTSSNEIIIDALRKARLLTSAQEQLKIEILYFAYSETYKRHPNCTFEFNAAGMLREQVRACDRFDKRLKLAELVSLLYDIYFWLSQNLDWFGTDKKIRREDFIEMIHSIKLGLVSNDDELGKLLAETAMVRKLQSGAKTRYYNLRNAFYLKALDCDDFALVKAACESFVDYIDKQAVVSNSFAAQLKNESIPLVAKLRKGIQGSGVSSSSTSSSANPFLFPATGTTNASVDNTVNDINFTL